MSYCFFFQAEDGIRDLVRSRGLGDVYKRQMVRFLVRLRLVEVTQVFLPYVDTISYPLIDGKRWAVY